MIKKNICLFAFLLAGLLTSCKQDEWYDWKTLNQLYLEQNKEREGVITTHTGLQYSVAYEGTTVDRKPNPTSYVTVSYTGRFIDGTIFEQKTLSGYMSTFIAGWIEGLCKMHLNSDFTLYIPYDLAYGTEGTGSKGVNGFIPPYSTLVFEMHLSDIMD